MNKRDKEQNWVQFVRVLINSPGAVLTGGVGALVLCQGSLSAPAFAQVPIPVHPIPINLASLKILSILPQNPLVGQTITVNYELDNVGMGTASIGGTVGGSFGGQTLRNADGTPQAPVTVAPRATAKGSLVFTPTAPSSGNLTLGLYGPPACSPGPVGRPCKVPLLTSAHSPLTIVEPTVHVRIAGQTYADVAMKDSRDNSSAQNGYLYISHDPGCGWWGNNATDKFFDNKLLPAGATLEGVDYLEFWPLGIDASYAGGDGLGTGSYGASLSQYPYPSVKWENSCWSVFGGKAVKYAISFRIAMPQGTNLGEPTTDPTATPAPPSVPDGYSRTPGTGTNIAPPLNFYLVNKGTSFQATFGTLNAQGAITDITNGEDESILILSDKNLNSGCNGTGNVQLTAHAAATAAQMATLYGTSTTKYPKTIGACLTRPNDGSKQSLLVVVSYQPQ